jgi:hypothetical protein
MRRRELGGAAAAVLAGILLSTAAIAGDPPQDESPPPSPSSNWGGSMHSSSWFKGMFGTQDSKKEPQPEKKSEPQSEPAPRTDKGPAKDLAPAPKPADQARRAASLRGQEQAALLRRLAVCDQLKLIAYQTKDDALLHRAEQLEDRAQSLYAQRIAHLPVSKAPVPPSNASAEKAARPASASDNTLHATSLPGVKDKAAAVTAENKS